MQVCNLSAINIACRRGDRILFRGVEANVKAGSALHITGSNGVGKSSFIRILAGLLTPYEGAVNHNGAIGLMDERPALDPQAPLGSALAFWNRIDQSNASHGGSGEANALENSTQLLGLDNLLDVPFRYLSTGQRKRAAFARLLGQNAKIWLLDEPLNGLDSGAKGNIEGLIGLHCSQGGICVIASHQEIELPEASVLPLEDFAL